MFIQKAVYSKGNFHMKAPTSKHGRNTCRPHLRIVSSSSFLSAWGLEMTHWWAMPDKGIYLLGILTLHRKRTHCVYKNSGWATLHMWFSSFEKSYAVLIKHMYSTHLPGFLYSLGFKPMACPDAWSFSTDLSHGNVMCLHTRSFKNQRCFLNALWVTALWVCSSHDNHWKPSWISNTGHPLKFTRETMEPKESNVRVDVIISYRLHLQTGIKMATWVKKKKQTRGAMPLFIRGRARGEL